MNTIVILSALCAVAAAAPGYLSPAVPYAYLGTPLNHDGSIADTAEVAHAKAEHLARYAYEAARNSHGHAYAPATGVAHVAQIYTPAHVAYGPAAPLGHDGRVVDTPEVAHAKAEHFAAHAQESAKSVGHSYGALAYSSVPVYAYGYGHSAPLAADGTVIDTPEVAHAKAEHLAAHAHEAAKTAGHAYGALAYPSAPVYAYGYGHSAPLAADGTVIDTPEVAHAKAEHLAAHAHEAAKTAGHAYGALAYSSAPVYAYGYGHSAPLAADGTVVDTPEVAHAKAAHLAAHAHEAAKTAGHY